MTEYNNENPIPTQDEIDKAAHLARLEKQKAKKKAAAKRNLGISAATLTVAGLIFGGTFALWSDEESIASGVIQSGHLNLSSNPGNWYSTGGVRAVDIDNATDVTSGNVIDLTNFHMIPGDTIASMQTFDLDLLGDNLKATLTPTVTTNSNNVALVSDVHGVSLETIVFGANGEVVDRAELNEPLSLVFASYDYIGDPTGAIITQQNNTSDVTISIVAHFDESTPDQVRQDMQLELSQAKIVLEALPVS